MIKFDITNSTDAEQWLLRRPKIHRPLVVKTLAQAVQNPSETVKGFHVCTGDGGKVCALLVMECRDRTPLGYRVIGFEEIRTQIELTQAVAYLDNCIRSIAEGRAVSTIEHDPLEGL